MWIEDYFNLSFEEFYSNPFAVALALFALVFIICFAGLMNVRAFKKNRSAAGIIAFSIAALFFYQFRELNQWLATFNVLLVLACVAILIKFILIPFWKFFRSQY